MVKKMNPESDIYRSRLFGAIDGTGQGTGHVVKLFTETDHSVAGPCDARSGLTSVRFFIRNLVD